MGKNIFEDKNTIQIDCCYIHPINYKLVPSPLLFPYKYSVLKRYLVWRKWDWFKTKKLTLRIIKNKWEVLNMKCKIDPKTEKSWISFACLIDFIMQFLPEGE